MGNRHEPTTEQWVQSIVKATGLIVNHVSKVEKLLSALPKEDREKLNRDLEAIDGVLWALLEDWEV